MIFRTIVLTTLAAALPFMVQAQTRTRRPPRPTSERAAPPKPNATRAAPAAARAAAPSGINITAADMSLIIDALGFTPEARTRLSSNPEERKDLAKDFRRMLAAAEEAKANGYLTRPELNLQTQLARSFVIAQAYFKQREAAGVTNPEQVITAAEIDAFFNEPSAAQQFEAFVQDYSKNSQLRGAAVSEEQRKELRGHYGRVMVGMRKGVTAGLDRDRKTQLSIMLQQARLLAAAYAKDMNPRMRAADAEVDAYIMAHPEYDTKAERAKIETILARVHAGEDFARLADELTEDPSGKGKGGDLGWFGRGAMVKPFEDAAFALKAGEVSGVIETQFGFHIAKLDERRAQGQGEELHARHILIKYKSTSPTAMYPRDQARAALEAEKLDRALDEAAQRRHITVAEDYVIATGQS